MQRLLIAAAAWLALCAAPAQAGLPLIHAHRGGSLTDGVPTLPENSLPAFERAGAAGFVIELDVKLSSDRKPVVIHDDTLDRTTTCTGTVGLKTLAQLRDCRLDQLGTTGHMQPIPAPTERIPTLEEALGVVRDTNARVNLEIKNLPGDSDFDPGSAYADDVLRVVRAAALPSRQLLIQSFYPSNLDAAKAMLPGVETSFLTLESANGSAPEAAASRGYEYISPGFGAGGLTPDLVARAHSAGRKVVPYTLDTPAQIKAAAAEGVDELITNDPQMARRALAEVEPPAPPMPAPPSPPSCRGVRADRTVQPIEAYDQTGGARTPRVFAMQYKQDVRNVVTYAAFRTKVECLIREWVVPRMAVGRPNVVAFNEDVGLLTLATGTRGAPAREAFARKGGASCESDGAPCATLGALALVRGAYAREVSAYRARFPQASQVSDAFVAATDTFARGWMQTFSDMARRYGVYILGSNDQSPFRESVDPSEIATFADPDLSPAPASVYVATTDAVYNEVFLWGPEEIRREGPRPLRNVLAQNKKVPLTPIEELIELRKGPATGPDAIDNLRPFAVPGSAARIGFATSLPAFVYGEPGGDPCADVSKTYMRCLDKLGANLVVQDEANPGRWAAPGGNSKWQPLEWMSSTYRAASDPSVAFDYNVTPHMVGNLADLPFDGQTAITQRGLTSGSACHYIGNGAFVEGEDGEAFRAFAGPGPRFLALAPWVTPDGPRDALRATSAKLAPGSGDALENDYVETAVAADLPFPPAARRAGCRGADPKVVSGAPGPAGSGGAGARGAALRRLRVAKRQSLRKGRRRGIRVRLTVSRAVRVRVVVRAGRRVAGVRTVRLRRAGSRTVLVKLRRGLRSGRTLRLRVTARGGSRTLRAVTRGR